MSNFEKMTDLESCPYCGGTRISVDEERYGILWGCGIGCLNLDCAHGLVIRYGVTRERARKKAVKAWNRGCSL